MMMSTFAMLQFEEDDVDDDDDAGTVCNVTLKVASASVPTFPPSCLITIYPQVLQYFSQSTLFLTTLQEHKLNTLLISCLIIIYPQDLRASGSPVCTPGQSMRTQDQYF